MKSTKFKTKTEKGITLIALIITIVVLMILAAVAINSITNDGIIGKAESVKNTYTEKVDEEQKMLDYYELVLAGTAWTQNGKTVTRGNVTLNVGDVIGTDVQLQNPEDKTWGGYTAYNHSGWAVLGVEYGKLLLVSVGDIPVDASGNTKVALGGLVGGTIGRVKCEAGLNNGIAYLNKLCSDNYINKTYADEARSMNWQDIYRINGLSHTDYYDADLYGEEFVISMEDLREVGAERFETPGGEKVTEEKGVTLVSTYYLEITNDWGIPAIFGDRNDDEFYFLAETACDPWSWENQGYFGWGSI